MAVTEVKLCLLGDSGVGKSSIVHRFVYDTFRPYLENTIGAAFLTKTMIIDGRTFKFQIWDTAGQEKYRALAPMYYRGAAAAIIVYDITQEKTFTSVKSWLAELKRHGSPNIVMAVAGNKQDMEDLREVTHREALGYAESQGSFLVETSAKSAINIAPLFMEIGKRLANQDASMTLSAGNTDTIMLSRQRRQQEQTRRKRTCCGGNAS